MTINGRTRLLGVMGDPIEHTKSPVIHNNLAAKLGHNLVYVPFHVNQQAVKEAVEGAYALNILGMNVTVPMKSQVIPYLSELDELAARIGAVNTLVRTEAGYKGYNTDMPGLYRAMRSDGISIDGDEVILLGAGGVARAVAVMLATKASYLYIVNRTVEKAEQIAVEVNEYAGRKMASSFNIEEIKEYVRCTGKKYLVIQATNVGMHPKVEGCVIEDEDFYEHVHTGYDLIYNPEKTKFMQRVEQSGGKSYNGLKMLLYQGIIAYELWNQVQVEESIAKGIYIELKESMK